MKDLLISKLNSEDMKAEDLTAYLESARQVEPNLIIKGAVKSMINVYKHACIDAGINFAELARELKISRQWLYQKLAKFKADELQWSDEQKETLTRLFGGNPAKGGIPFD